MTDGKIALDKTELSRGTRREARAGARLRDAAPAAWHACSLGGNRQT